MSTENSINENNEEYLDNAGDNSRSYNLLKTEYEICRQENHDLKRKLELNEAMLRTIQETNESLEHSQQQFATEKQKEISVLEEKHRHHTKEYENIILNLETQLAERTEELTKLRQQAEAECTGSKPTPVADELKTLTLEAENVRLRNRIDEFMSTIKERKKDLERAEETIKYLKSQCNTFESSSEMLRIRLEEKNQVLEEIRAELALRRAEAAAFENHPTSELYKGNSLFAEVEDRRQMLMSTMSKLRDQYRVVKRICKSQIIEIKKLRAERTATLRQWEADFNNTLENEELIQKYKNRISDLESKLKTEIDKNTDSKEPDSTATNFEYFQFLLNAKKKEINEYRMKIESLSTKLLIEEETKRNVTKELRYWKHKASSLEAQLCAAQAEQQLYLMDDDDDNGLLKEVNDYKGGLESVVQSFPNSDSDTDTQLTEEAKSDCNNTTKLNTVRFQTSLNLNEEKTIDDKKNEHSTKSVLFTKNTVTKSDSVNENRRN
ncbi:protein Spindly [Ceratina calcarata]|uniref:Protein Spindly n=1 Tax=Ceratina calcarata TaxID=156304 RepID=A0AAJ7IVU9_9HYME|nr:protein Spindly [Ceratina calcarata]